MSESTSTHPARSTPRWRHVAIVTAAMLSVGAVAQPGTSSAGQNAKESAAVETSADADWSVPVGTMYSVVDQIGARVLWERGFTGAGVNVAVIDTGVADVPALSGADKVVALVDLSAEAAVPEAVFTDTYGHGTHMAGIIAGRDPGADPALARQHPEWFLGVAPDAGIVSVKVGDNTGAVDITQVIAGVDWVVDHADELDIGVLNLSYSSESTLGYEIDPLAFAVERAWNAGIVVVVAAGNDGKHAYELASPANDPYVIAVAAAEAEPRGNRGERRPRYKVPSWATSGSRTRAPDLAAPGAHIESLRAPLSRADLEHPEGYVDEYRFLGSGSSQASAVVAGAAALLLDARPELTPDQVKALLTTKSDHVAPGAAKYSGSGLVRVDRIIDVPAPTVRQTWVPSDGTGSIELARGGHTVVVDGVVLSGEVTVLGSPWVGARWSGARWSAGSWDGVRWSNGEWMGVRWSGASWSGARWSGVRWSGVRWSGVRWSDAAWSTASWTGTRWSGTRWSGASWSADVWDGARWSSMGWS